LRKKKWKDHQCWEWMLKCHKLKGHVEKKKGERATNLENLYVFKSFRYNWMFALLKEFIDKNNLILNKHVIFNLKTFFWKFMELLSLLICHGTMTALTLKLYYFQKCWNPK
jgi:hypothetical protein